MMEVISENVQGNRTDMIPGDTYIMMNFLLQIFNSHQNKHSSDIKWNITFLIRYNLYNILWMLKSYFKLII